jgi:FkbM family methyltransferase
VITVAAGHKFQRCIAIEPAPSNLAELRCAVESRKLQNCQIFPVALADRAGVATLYFSRSDKIQKFDSLVRRDGLLESIQTPVTTLDNIVEESGTTGPFVIKIDVEGYELKVCKGAVRTLAQECTIVSEFWPWGLRSAGSRPYDYILFMKERGYEAHSLNGRLLPEAKLYRLSEMGEHDPFVVTDILFLK